jgi:hypothetical protein
VPLLQRLLWPTVLPRSGFVQLSQDRTIFIIKLGERNSLINAFIATKKIAYQDDFAYVASETFVDVYFAKRLTWNLHQ